MPPKPAPKAIKMTNEEAEGRVKEYLLKQNRPYSITDVHMNLRGVIGKTQIGKAFDGLEASNQIVVKLYGKQKVYLINQDNFPDLNEEEVKKAEEELQELEGELKTQQNAKSSEERALDALKRTLTTPDMIKKIEELKSTNEDKEKNLAMLSSGTTLFSKEEKENALTKYTYAVKQWKRRKRTANEMVDQLSEGMNEKPKKVCEIIGVETDEEVNASLKNYPL